jgi:hypothetical protein
VTNWWYHTTIKSEEITYVECTVWGRDKCIRHGRVSTSPCALLVEIQHFYSCSLWLHREVGTILHGMNHWLDAGVRYQYYVAWTFFITLARHHIAKSRPLDGLGWLNRGSHRDHQHVHERQLAQPAAAILSQDPSIVLSWTWVVVLQFRGSSCATLANDSAGQLSCSDAGIPNLICHPPITQKLQQWDAQPYLYYTAVNRRGKLRYDRLAFQVAIPPQQPET